MSRAHRAGGRQLATRAAQRAAGQEQSRSRGWAARLQEVGAAVPAHAAAPWHRKPAAGTKVTAGRAAACSSTQRAPRDPQCITTQMRWLSATELKPTQEETLPGTFYTSCRALPHGLNAPHARSTRLVPHVHRCTCRPCRQPVPPRNRGEQGRDGCWHGGTPLPNAPSPGTGASNSPAGKPCGSLPGCRAEARLAVAVRSH